MDAMMSNDIIQHTPNPGIHFVSGEPFLTFIADAHDNPTSPEVIIELQELVQKPDHFWPAFSSVVGSLRRKNITYQPELETQAHIHQDELDGQLVPPFKVPGYSSALLSAPRGGVNALLPFVWTGHQLEAEYKGDDGRESSQQEPCQVLLQQLSRTQARQARPRDRECVRASLDRRGADGGS